MDMPMLEAALKMHIREMRERLDQAGAIARAAEACANVGNLEKAIEIANDIDQLVYEATTLLNAASLMNRLACERPATQIRRRPEQSPERSE